MEIDNNGNSNNNNNNNSNSNSNSNNNNSEIVGYDLLVARMGARAVEKGSMRDLQTAIFMKMQVCVLVIRKS